MEISLIKKNEGLTWPELVVGDKQGEFIRDSAQCAAIAERLMHLTSEELVRIATVVWLCRDQQYEEYAMFPTLFCFSKVKDTDKYCWMVFEYGLKF